MIKSITFLRYQNYPLEAYIYKLIDTEFQCDIMSTAYAPVLVGASQEYQRRNYSYQEIIKNLFKCNLFLSKILKCSFEKSLEWQNVNFDKRYYQGIKNMWDKHKVFM